MQDSSNNSDVEKKTNILKTEDLFDADPNCLHEEDENCGTVIIDEEYLNPKPIDFWEEWINSPG